MSLIINFFFSIYKVIIDFFEDASWKGFEYACVVSIIIILIYAFSITIVMTIYGLVCFIFIAP